MTVVLKGRSFITPDAGPLFDRARESEAKHNGPVNLNDCSSLSILPAIANFGQHERADELMRQMLIYAIWSTECRSKP